MKSRRWKHEAQVSHHLFMLILLATLDALNTLLEMLKLRNEASVILIYTILHRVESSIIDYYELLHMSVK